MPFAAICIAISLKLLAGISSLVFGLLLRFHCSFPLFLDFCYYGNLAVPAHAVPRLRGLDCSKQSVLEDADFHFEKLVPFLFCSTQNQPLTITSEFFLITCWA